MTDINDPACVETAIHLSAPCGSKSLYGVSEQQVREFQRDPDGFAAAHFGMTRDDYREWVTLYGQALCGAVTKKGKPCSIGVRDCSQDPDHFMALHRNETCHLHSGK